MTKKTSDNSKKSADSINAVDYAATNARLGAILQRLQDESIAIDEAISLHKEGSELVALLEEYLAKADVTIKKQLQEQ